MGRTGLQEQLKKKNIYFYIFLFLFLQFEFKRKKKLILPVHYTIDNAYRRPNSFCLNEVCQSQNFCKERESKEIILNKNY